MLWVKLLGGGLIMLAGGLTARALNRADSRRLEQLDGLITLLRFIKTQIECYCIPVGEILRRIDEPILLACGVSGRPTDFSSFLEDRLSPVPSEKVSAVLRSFSSELGTSYRNEQLKSCDRHIAKLCDLRAASALESAGRRKLNTTLCLSAAAGAVILLL